MLPLQTHGLFDEVWVPPISKSRFVVYDRSDESWMRPFGLGRIEKRTRRLYDVRLFDGSLVGFTNEEPRADERCRILPVSPVTTARFSATARPSLQPFTEIQIRTSRYAFDRDQFICWQVMSHEDAAALVRVGWIKLLGEDDIDRFCHDLRRKAFERRDRFPQRVG